MTRTSSKPPDTILPVSTRGEQSPLIRNVVSGLVLLGCAITFGGNLPGIGTTLQPLFLVCFGAAAVLAVLSGRIAAIRLTVPEFILYAASLLSAVVALCRSIEQCMLYSMVFLVALVMISVIVRVLTLERILDIGAVLIVVLLLTSVLFDGAHYVKALSYSVSRVYGLYRYTPFNNHPNLTGFIFGAGSILVARRAFVARSLIERIVMSVATVMAWSFVVAASARASVVALIVATIVTVIKEWRPTKAVILSTLSAAAVAILIAATAFGSPIILYLEKMLEVNSRTRGINSGATGRVVDWTQSLDALITHPLVLAFGGSLRSSDVSIIGFDAMENSYLTIFLDFGLFMGTAIICIYLYGPFKSAVLSKASDEDRRRLFLVPAFFVFLLIESIFNRYLLAIGNPLSLIELMIVISLYVNYRESAVQSVTTPARKAEPERSFAQHPGAPAAVLKKQEPVRVNRFRERQRLR